MTELSMRGVAMAYRHTPVLTGVNLDVAAGRMTALLGTSGSGKTTLLRIIIGFLAPDGGVIRIGGEVVSGESVFRAPERRRVGYVAQEGALFPHLSVAGNVSFGLPWRRRGRQVEELLDVVGIPASYARRHPHELSGGEQQRIAVARALATRPRALLLDEPFTSLDPALRADTRQAVCRVLADAGTTTLLVTHDQAEALSLADQVAVLRDGVIVQVADPITIYRSPVDPQLAAFLGEVVLVPGTVSNATVTCPLGMLPVAATPNPPRGQALVMVRPEQIRWYRSEPNRAAVPAHAIATTYHGHEAVVQFALDNGTADPRILSSRCPGHHLPAIGERTWLTVNGTVVAYPPDSHLSSRHTTPTKPQPHGWATPVSPKLRDLE